MRRWKEESDLDEVSFDTRPTAVLRTWKRSRTPSPNTRRARDMRTTRTANWSMTEMHTTETTLTDEQLLRIHSLMVQARVLEERLIKMNKGGEGYFWIGGPGEEAFAVPLGLLLRKGQGIQHDYLHLHYRSSSVILAMGADPLDIVRQMKSLSTDPYTCGRNFVNHPVIWEWNVVPVTSPIEVQYAQCLGTAHAQRAPRCTGITIVTGGDAGTAEGDFASALVWAFVGEWCQPDK